MSHKPQATSSAANTIEYRPEWTDELGYMTGALEYAMQLPVGSSVHGVRWVDGKPEVFTIKRHDLTNARQSEASIVLKTADELEVQIRPANLDVYNRRVHGQQPIRKYRRYMAHNAKVWVLISELTEVKHDCSDYCPAYQNWFVSQYSALLHKYWKKHTYEGPGPGGNFVKRADFPLDLPRLLLPVGVSLVSLQGQPVTQVQMELYAALVKRVKSGNGPMDPFEKILDLCRMCVNTIEPRQAESVWLERLTAEWQQVARKGKLDLAARIYMAMRKLLGVVSRQPYDEAIAAIRTWGESEGLNFSESAVRAFWGDHPPQV